MPSADSANKWRRQRMNVKRAKTAGFCFGVKRAVETVYEQAKKFGCSTNLHLRTDHSQ